MPLINLSNYGKTDDILEWIKTWLTLRTQQVVLDSVSSAPALVRSGVPHSTVCWDPSCF